jgi:hypothetical protein
MSQRGDCWDNAPVDSVFATLKLELVYHRRYIPPEIHTTGKRGATSLNGTICEWIAVFYNRKRMHSKLGYQSAAYYEAQTAALAASLSVHRNGEIPVVCMDEMSLQPLKEVRDLIEARPGAPYRYDHHYDRNGTVNLFTFF